MKEQNNTENNSKLFTSKNIIDANWATDAIDLLLDLKCLMREYYVGTFTEDGEALKLSFNNGQSFILSIESCV